MAAAGNVGLESAQGGGTIGPGIIADANRQRRPAAQLAEVRSFYGPISRSDDAAMCAMRRQVRRHIEKPDAFPLIERGAEVFGRVDQLLGTTARVG